MRTTVTITLDEETARWARAEAAHRDISVSLFIRELLDECMRAQATYDDAMRRYLARAPTALKAAGRCPSREELHDRDGLR
jgi:predicted transcriptional regulator